MRASAVILREYGGPDKLALSPIDVPSPGSGQILLRHTAIAVNFHDIYVRSGLYRSLSLPGIPGLECVGIVEAVGPETTRFNIGDRVAWISPSYGGYASHRVLPAELAISLPNGLNDDQVAGSLVKALTAQMLTRISYTISSGQVILVHAAAGGVGQMLCRWAKNLGATVIATVGSEKKAMVAQRCGADHTILYREEDFVARVMAVTDGQGVAAVFDSVGADTFMRSLECLDYGGALINYGQSSGTVPQFSAGDLAKKSLSVCRPILFHFLRSADQRAKMAEEAFQAFEAGLLEAVEPLRMKLSEVADAHRIIEAGESPGGIVLSP